MYTILSIVCVFFSVPYFLTAFIARKTGHKNVAEKIKKQALRSLDIAVYFDGGGPWPKKL